VSQFEIDALTWDLAQSNLNHGVAIGGGGLLYFYFIDTSWPRGMAVAAGIVGATGLVTQRPRRHAIDVLSAPMPAGSAE
jgi:hypothetical protein